MPYRVAQTTLNASTLDILNVIRQNASYDYQNLVPRVEKAADIPKVGEVICGTPALANQFINALVNRIALVRVNSATFNNPYSRLKKGYLDFGELIEDIFVGIAKVVDYSAEKGAEREMKRTLPDVKSAFYAMNWRVMYPVTIQDDDLERAFLSIDGVQGLIANIVDQVYVAAEYDEFLLFKYLLIKAISHGKMYPLSIGANDDYTGAAVQFRSMSNLLPFMLTEYNTAGVKTNTPRDRQVIFMDATFNAQFDVNVLASAFNMDKANFMGSLYLIDNWTSFDNDRFAVIRKNSDAIEEITSDELALLANVKAVILDENWFQVYDNKNKFTEDYISAGLYWNYFYHTWKTVASSPFANAVVFVSSGAAIALPESFTVEVTGKSISPEATVFTLGVQDDNASLAQSTPKFVQSEALTRAGIAIQEYGAVIIPASQQATEITLIATLNGTKYQAATSISSAQSVGATVTMNKM